jgi:2-methylfumaryl-CoA isomerase
MRLTKDDGRLRVMSGTTGILAGLRVVEVAAFIAAPLCGMVLAQQGAEVVRIDPIGGGADYNRWPVTASAKSLYWAGLNKAKRSILIDLRSPEGQEIATALITAAGENARISRTRTGWVIKH